jgi:HlyD family secretion protein
MQTIATGYRILCHTDAPRTRRFYPIKVEAFRLSATVRTVEPYGFTKVSALGIEEQRVNVIADFIDSPDGLGDGYRVDARIVIWESLNVLKVPTSALFRVGQQRSAFAVQDGRAHLLPVEVGHRNASEAEIMKGLKEGAQVILHPANDLKDGARVTARGNGKT